MHPDKTKDELYFEIERLGRNKRALLQKIWEIEPDWEPEWPEESTVPHDPSWETADVKLTPDQYKTLLSFVGLDGPAIHTGKRNYSALVNSGLMRRKQIKYMRDRYTTDYEMSHKGWLYLAERGFWDKVKGVYERQIESLRKKIEERPDVYRNKDKLENLLKIYEPLKARFEGSGNNQLSEGLTAVERQILREAALIMRALRAG